MHIHTYIHTYVHSYIPLVVYTDASTIVTMTVIRRTLTCLLCALDFVFEAT